MNSSVFRVSLNIHETHSQVALYVKKGDTARKIIITFTEGGKPYYITKDCFAVFTATKPDGRILFNVCAIVGNSIEYTLSPQSTAVEGEVSCEMRLYGANSALIASPRFTIFVGDTVYNDEGSVESSDEFSALTALIAQTFAVKENLEEMLGKSICYREIGDPIDSNRLIANIQQDGGVYHIDTSERLLGHGYYDWADRPHNRPEEFALIISRYSSGINLQIAFSKEDGSIYTRFVPRTEYKYEELSKVPTWDKHATSRELMDITDRVIEIEENGATLDHLFKVESEIIALNEFRAIAEESISDFQEYVSWLYHDLEELKQEFASEINSIRETYGYDIHLLDGYVTELSAKLEDMEPEIAKLIRDVAANGYHILGLEDRVNDLAANSAFVVVDGKVCTVSTDASGEGWHQVEAAAEMDEPYLNEWGWQCAQEDGTTELYKWIYRCLKEGFSVPYRTIVVDGVEHRFATELTERDRTWVALATNPESGLSPIEFINQPGYDPEEAAWMCVPLVQFGSMQQSEIAHAFERVRLDNPILCAMPLSQIGFVYDEERSNILYAYFIRITEAASKKLINLIAKATRSIDKYVKEFTSPNSSETENKIVTAEIIHDYIIWHNEPATVTIAGAGYTPLYYQPTLYAALDPNKRALCDGYTQAFNFFARAYGINSIAMSASVTHDGESAGGHVWNVVNFGDYGVYSADPSEWSPIDVYWDEPLHELEIRPERTDIPNSEAWWEYFGNPDNVFKDDYLRTIKKTDGYGRYPFDNDDGSTPYPSAELGGLYETGSYEWED